MHWSVNRVTPLALGVLWLVIATALAWASWIDGEWWLLAAALAGVVGWIALDGVRGRGTPDRAALPAIRGRARLAALMGALVSYAAGAWALGLAMMLANFIHSPDPSPGLDGDPCCAYPDTWADVAIGGVYFAAVAFVAVVALAASTVLAVCAMRGRVPPAIRRRAKAARRVSAAALLCAVGVPASWAAASLIWP